MQLNSVTVSINIIFINFNIFETEIKISIFIVYFKNKNNKSIMH